MPADLKRVKEIFLAAVEKPTPAERQAFLHEACGADDELRRQVEALLRQHEQPSGFLESPPPGLVQTVASDRGAAADPAGAPAPGPEAVGGRIGPYKLLQELGEGGMGTVFLAEQAEPVKRRVALKVIKAGMDSAHVIARFEQERQALAVMDHPNIAKVLDGGTTASGRPYFVMELVKGLKITQYCDQEHLTPKERLELFIPVCQAVQHAHQKGIIHRDLKPSNVLIALYDGKPIPKVIDFGVAKATAQKLTERTMFTEVGQMVGTLEYMAPEQAELNNLDIDTRADIYSLGVLLYELLAGSPPFTAQQLRSAAFTEMLRMIREVEPPKPSTKLSSSAELASIAANRHLEPARLTKLVHGDLDWIAMKCLAKERNRRYETANGLAMDIQRYLADEPVLAGPPGLPYRLKKFFRRNRVPMLASSLVLVLLLAGIAGTTLGLVRALAAESKTRAALDEVTTEKNNAERARIAADSAGDEARKAAAKAEAMNRFLIRDMLRAGDPAKALGRKITVEEVVDAAARKISTAFHDQPEIEAGIRDTLAGVYWHLGRYEAAEEHWTAALAIMRRLFGEERRGTINRMSDLAMVLERRGKLREAEALRFKALELARRVLGPEDRDTLGSSRNLVALLFDQGKWAEAEPIARQNLELVRRTNGEEHVTTARSMSMLGLMLRNLGKLDEAEQVSRKALDLFRRRQGERDPETLRAASNLAVVLIVRNKFPEAETLLRQTISVQRDVLGEDHHDTLATLQNLSQLLRRQRKLAEAETFARKAFQLTRRKFGDNHRSTMLARNNAATLLLEQGKLAEAEPEIRDNLNRQRRQLGPSHPDTLVSMNNLSLVLTWQGKLAEAEALARKVLAGHRIKLGDKHPMTLDMMINLASLLHDQSKLAEAEPLAREVFETRRRLFGPQQPETLHAMSRWAELRADQGHLPEAEHLYRELLALRRKAGPDRLGEISSVLAGLGWVLTQRGENKEAEKLLREVLELNRKAPPRSNWAWLSARNESLLGACLSGQRRYKEAEPLLVKSYAILKGRPAAPPIRKLQALERIVRLYDDWGKPVEAARWRKELEAHKLKGTP